MGIASFAMCLLEIENDESANRVNSAINTTAGPLPGRCLTTSNPPFFCFYSTIRMPTSSR
jgi:hypothetical protein